MTHRPLVHGTLLPGLRGGFHRSPDLEDKGGPAIQGQFNSMFAEQWRGPAGEQVGEGHRLAQLPDSAVGMGLCSRQVKGSHSLTHSSLLRVR